MWLYAMKLTQKQRLFADEYIKSGNATQAYIKAGYKVRSDKVAGVNATRMLGNARVKAYIDAKMTEIESRKIADAKEVLQFYTRVLRKEETEPEKLMKHDGSEEIVNREPSLKDRLSAAKEIMKRYPLSDPMVQAQLKKLNADTRISEARAEALKHGDTDITKIVFSDDLTPDKEDDSKQEGGSNDGTDTKP